MSHIMLGDLGRRDISEAEAQQMVQTDSHTLARANIHHGAAFRFSPLQFIPAKPVFTAVPLAPRIAPDSYVTGASR